MDKHSDALLGAVKRGDLDSVHNLVEAGTSVDTSHGLQGTLLCAAIQANQSEVALFLIDSECDVNATDIDGEPPVCLAIRKGHKDILDGILKSKRCDIHRIDPVSLNPPLNVAITHGTTEMVEMLVDAGCEVNKQGKDYNTAFHLAAIHQRLEVIDILIKAKYADVNMWNKSGKSALHIAAEQQDTTMLSCLIEKCLLQKSSDLSSRPMLDLNRQIMFDGNTPLHIAIDRGNFRSAEMLVEASCKVDLPNENMETPLFFACRANCLATAALLLRKDANPNSIGECHKQFHVHNKTSVHTPLYIAIRQGSLQMVQLLVEHGANLNLRAAGNYPLIQALMEDKQDIVRYFLTAGPNRGLDMSLVDGSHGQNALGVVMCCGNVRENTQWLIDLGCSVSCPHDGRLPLEYAVNFDCSEAIEVLLDNGADVNMPLNGQTALQHCITDEMSEHLLHLLLFYGADVNVKTPEGHSLIKLALDSYNLSIVKYLVAFGYNVSQDPMLQEFIKDSRESKIETSRDTEYDSENDSSGSSQDSQAELYDWLAQRGSNPCPLQTQCRTAIRNYYVQNHINMKTMEELPLPVKLKNYVMLKTLFEESLRI